MRYIWTVLFVLLSFAIASEEVKSITESKLSSVLDSAPSSNSLLAAAKSGPPGLKEYVGHKMQASEDWGTKQDITSAFQYLCSDDSRLNTLKTLLDLSQHQCDSQRSSPTSEFSEASDLLCVGVFQRSSIGRNGLAIACNSNSVEIVKYFLKEYKKQDKLDDEINHRDANGATPFLLASRQCSEETLQLLIDHGADPTLQSKLDGDAFQIAVLNSNPAAEFLLHLSFHDRASIALYLNQMHEHRDFSGRPFSEALLHKLARKRSISGITYLLENGANVNILYTPFVYPS